MHLPLTKFHMYLEDYYFAGHMHKYMREYTKRRFPTLILTKE